MGAAQARRTAVALVATVAACLAYLQVGGGAERTALALARFEGAPGAVGVPAEARALGLRFASGVPVEQQVAVLAAVQRAHPVARRLIDRVDGLVEVRLHDRSHPPALGITRARGREIAVSLDPTAMSAFGAGTYELVVLHELGHVVDHVLVDEPLLARLDAGIPRSTPCADPESELGPCADPVERFADTFAKWALGWPAGIANVGYDVEVPPDLAAWGAPLERLAAER
jgi:hypothetical protein